VLKTQKPGASFFSGKIRGGTRGGKSLLFLKKKKQNDFDLFDGGTTGFEMGTRVGLHNRPAPHAGDPVRGSTAP